MVTREFSIPTSIDSLFTQGDPAVRVYFSPYKTFDSIPLPESGSSMMLPPSSGPHVLLIQTLGRDISPS